MSDTAPDILVVDSSVAVKWFLSDREDHVDSALRLLRAHLDERQCLAAPAHLRLEVLNALLRRGLDAGALERASAALDGFRLEWHGVDGAMAGSAARIAAAHGLTLYDGAFAALALDLDAELVTDDRRLAASGACRTRLLGT
jgi:predicted nucleic acid-binding protein